ncbi:hypothetical protein T4B_1806 [Trichinella pseudospiralis]|uniref:Uncharacterized protein n=1 Tax=Trichinella pseudospiralis TaxID=6337 RepID=A0A0V1JUF3_TRIPS|nr:hypothetical protein T4B_1806 [Trichinella pseudospiralis]KRZ38591.1 hypothetical protein T4C_11947 [Trichinella pseudospiralis]
MKVFRTLLVEHVSRYLKETLRITIIKKRPKFEKKIFAIFRKTRKELIYMDEKLSLHCSRVFRTVPDSLFRQIEENNRNLA